MLPGRVLRKTFRRCLAVSLEGRNTPFQRVRPLSCVPYWGARDAVIMMLSLVMLLSVRLQKLEGKELGP